VAIRVHMLDDAEPASNRTMHGNRHTCRRCPSSPNPTTTKRRFCPICRGCGRYWHWGRRTRRLSALGAGSVSLDSRVFRAWRESRAVLLLDLPLIL